MPNHVSAKFSVNGPRDDVDRFIVTVGENSIIRTLIPMPDAGSIIMFHNGKSIGSAFAEVGQHEDEARRQYEAGERSTPDVINGYDWCREHWGTKWGDYDTRLVSHEYLPEDRATAVYEFDTAWAPPTAAMLTISKMFPTLTLAYAGVDEGLCFVYWSVTAQGQTLGEGEVRTDDGPEEPDENTDPDAYDKWYDTVYVEWRDGLGAEAWRRAQTALSLSA